MRHFLQKCFNKSQKNRNESSNGSNNREETLIYGLDDVPPWFLTIFMALQHYLTMISAIISIPFILTPALCMKEDDPNKSYIIATMIFVTAIVTFLQVTFGCRLPIVQGGTISFLIPTLAILNQPQWKCPSDDIIGSMSQENRTEVWQIRMRELSGAIIVSALFQMFLGYFGIIGIIVRFVSPLSIIPTVSLVGLSLFENAADVSSKHWGISILTVLLLTLFSHCLHDVKFPVISYNTKDGLKISKFPLLKLFPVLVAIIVMWVFSATLTFIDYFPIGHPARTDTKLKIMSNVSWFRIPYPCQWGWPTFSLSSILGMLAGVFACTAESLGYYPIVAKMSGGPPPPLHVINRGIGTEGLGTVLAGIYGCGNGTNTFGENVGTIGVTKIGSRRVIQVLCILMLLQGVCIKFATLFIIIPDPIVGGIFCVMFGMITAFGLSALQYIDLNSSRNLFILGFTLLFSLALPKWLKNNPGAIQTGFPVLDNTLTVLLSTSILVGGVLGCFMDNLIPGTDEERGLIAWSNQMQLTVTTNEEACEHEINYRTYDFPVGMKFIKKYAWCSQIPCFPTYTAKQ